MLLLPLPPGPMAIAEDGSAEDELRSVSYSALLALA